MKTVVKITAFNQLIEKNRIVPDDSQRQKLKNASI
jgi:hypothetical protein